MDTNINSKQRHQGLLFTTAKHTQRDTKRNMTWQNLNIYKCERVLAHTHIHTQRPPVLLHSGGLWCLSVSVYTELTIIASTPPLTSLSSPSLPTRQADRHLKVETVIQNRHVWRSHTKDFPQSPITMGTVSEMIAGSMVYWLNNEVWH